MATTKITADQIVLDSLPGGGGGIGSVEEDTSPTLGGNLELAGFRILVTDSADAFRGALGYSPTVEALFLSENTPGDYLDDKAGISLQNGLLSLHGAQAQVKALVGVGYREVWCDPDGNLFPVLPAPPAWDVEDQSTAKVLPKGDDVDGVGAWVRITALECATAEDVAMGDAIGCTTRAYVNNLSAYSGDLEFGWGVGAAEPTAASGKTTVAVVAGFKGYVTANYYQEAVAAHPAGTLVTAWVRGLGTSLFAPWVDGLIEPHYLTVEAVGQSGGAVSLNPISSYTIQGATLTASAGTLTIPLDGKSYTYTLPANTTIAFSGAPVAPITADTVLVLKQAASGGPYGITAWPAGVKWPSGVPQTMPQTASARMRVTISTDALGIIDVSAMWMGV
jgi:hypothetical protein